MKLIKADQERRLELPGVPQPVRRPVDIDKSSTDFANLRSLRIYCFDAGSVIDGHAEEDEVLIIVLAGSVDLTLSKHESMTDCTSYVLMAVDPAAAGVSAAPVVAYLPPHGAYRMVPRENAQVAYARATPPHGRPPAVFDARGGATHDGIATLLQESHYAQRLRMRLVRIDPALETREVPLLEAGELGYEALVHVRTPQAADAGTLALISGTGDGLGLDSWDTAAVYPADRPTLRVASGASGLALLLMSR